MIGPISHTYVWVEDMDRALSFYTEKIGFEVRDDAQFGSVRWVTVGHPEQQELRLALLPLGALDPEFASAVRAMLASGAVNGGGLVSSDCAADYARLTALGVIFVQEPSPRPYGTEAIFRDDSGNLWGLVQPRLARSSLRTGPGGTSEPRRSSARTAR